MNALSLTDHRVLVTGGSRGLGFGIAEAMADAGARVAVLARTPSEVESATSRLSRSCGHVFDITNTEQLPELIDAVETSIGGQLTTVIHAAGIQHRQPAESFDLGAFRRVIEVNLIAPFALSQEIGRRQLASGSGGQHIFIGSLTSFISIPNASAYGASKSGISGLVRSLSTEWAHAGIRVNGIAPGYFPTELTAAVFSDEQRRAANLARIPAQRFGTPDEIGAAAAFLASDSSSYITGHMLPVDGGWLAA